jgi:hypothetical protein
MTDQISALEARVSDLEGGDGYGGSGGHDKTGGGDSGQDPVNDDKDSDGYTFAEGDCNDDDAAINPEKTEAPNGIDDNCNGHVDEGTTPVLESLIIETTDGSGTLTDALEYTASARYSDGSLIEVTNEANWQGEGAVTPTEPGVFLCVGAGSGQISATYQGTTETALYTCQLL